MTEESIRMICVEKEMVTFDCIHSIDWVPIEPAPPKDWKPLCFDEHSYADDKFCSGVHQTNWMGYVQPELEENCVDCPHRLKEESK